MDTYRFFGIIVTINIFFVVIFVVICNRAVNKKYNKKKEPLCDSCCHLIYKKVNYGICHYYCDQLEEDGDCSFFYDAPEICKYYKNKYVSE